MGDDKQILVRLAKSMRNSVNQCAERINKPTSQVARDLFRDFVDREEELARRRRAVDYATASTFFEGFTPNVATLLLFDRYTRGELTIDQVIAEVKCAALKAINRNSSVPQVAYHG